jgi:hypothetical protein
METESSLIEALLDRAEKYGRTTLELIKLKALDKSADITSRLISRLFLVIVVSIFTITLNIAMALWLGSLLGASYYGFFIVAAFYGFICIVLYFIHPIIKIRINNHIIEQILN